jgi:phage terminase small subunit
MAKASKTQPDPHLKGTAKAWWLDMLATYRDLDTDPDALRLLTEAAIQFQRAEEARKAIAQEGVVVSDRFGYPRENPAVAIERQATNLARLLVRELGLVSDNPNEAARLPRGK